MPFENSLMNYVGLFNETVALFISYLIAQINDLRYDPPTTVIIGNTIVYTIYLSWLVNGLVVLGVATSEVHGKLRKLYLTKLRWKYSWLRPKMDQQQQSETKRERQFPELEGRAGSLTGKKMRLKVGD